VRRLSRRRSARRGGIPIDGVGRCERCRNIRELYAAMNLGNVKRPADGFCRGDCTIRKNLTC
jgi:hypothetical protein